MSPGIASIKSNEKEDTAARLMMCEKLEKVAQRVVQMQHARRECALIPLVDALDAVLRGKHVAHQIVLDVDPFFAVGASVSKAEWTGFVPVTDSCGGSVSVQMGKKTIVFDGETVWMLKGNTWSRLNVQGESPGAIVSRGALCRVGSQVFVFGQGDRFLWVLNVAGDACVWERRTVDTLYGWTKMSATKVGDDVWLVGGVQVPQSQWERPRVSLWVYSLRYGTWTNASHGAGLGAFPSSIREHCVVRVGTQLLVHGGIIDATPSNRTLVIDTLKHCWRDFVASGETPRPRANHVAVTLLNRFMVVVGGGSSAVEMLDMEQRRWCARSVFGPSVAFDQMSAVVNGGELLLLGGVGRRFHDGLLVDTGASTPMPPSRIDKQMTKLLADRASTGDTMFDGDVRLHRFVLQARCPTLLDLCERADDEGAKGDVRRRARAKIVAQKALLVEWIVPWIYTGTRSWADNDEGGLLTRGATVARVLGLNAVARDMVAIQAVANPDGDMQDAAREARVAARAFEPLSVTLAAFFGDHVERARFADFSLECNGKTFPVHAALLRTYPHFSGVLASGMVESREKRMSLDTKTAAGECVLHFLYTGTVCAGAEEHAIELLSLSSYFKLDVLSRQAESLIQQHFDFDDLDNVLDLFDMAVMFNANNVRRSCIAVIRSRFNPSMAIKRAREMSISSINELKGGC